MQETLYTIKAQNTDSNWSKDQSPTWVHIKRWSMFVIIHWLYILILVDSDSVDNMDVTKPCIIFLSILLYLRKSMPTL